MRLGDTVLRGGITGVALFRSKLALTGDTAFELRLHFLASALFEGIGATDRERCECNRDQDRQRPHLLIL
jgi:hypothetical protein